MKYQAPYGVSDPNAAYINGNPSTGTMGSIPPAGSIEYPQREIVKVISDAGLVPVDSDLGQLSKAIQSGRLIYADDAGTVNNLAVTLSPAIVAAPLIKGLVIVTKVKNTNTGASVINVNGVGNWPIVHQFDQSPLNAVDLAANAMVALAYDGTSFQLVWSGRIAGAPTWLQAPRTFYVNGTTGSDTNDGTVATVGGGHGPFATLQKAANQIPLYNLNGYSITVYVADGTYAAVNFPKVNGSGTIAFIGNTGTPGNVVINAVNSSAIYLYGIGGAITFDGFKVQTSGAAPGDGIVGLSVAGTSVCYLGSFEFGQCNGAQMAVQSGAMISNLTVGANWRIAGGSIGNIYISSAFLYSNVGGNCIANVLGGPAITITAAASYTAFIAAFNNSFVQLPYTSLANPGFVTGSRYTVSYNSSINSIGGGANYYPGTSPGSVANGSYYT